MKNKSIVLLALGGIAASVVCLLQRSQIRELKSKGDWLQQTVEKQNREIEITQVQLKQAQRERNELSYQANDLTSELQALRAGTRHVPEAPTPAPDSATPASGSGQTKGGLFGDFLSKMLDDPNMKKMMRQQQAAIMDMMYGGLFKELGLTPEETDKFKELLLDSQMKAVDAGGVFIKLLGEDSDKTTAIDELAAQQKESDTQVKSFLGDERYAQYKEYTETMGERMVLNQFAQQLAEGQNPLSADQSGQLLEIMKQESKGATPLFGETSADGSATVANWQVMMSEEKMNELFKKQEESNQRILQRASAVLAPEQWQSFSNFQSGQLQMQRMGMTFAVKMFGTQNPENSESTNAKR